MWRRTHGKYVTFVKAGQLSAYNSLTEGKAIGLKLRETKRQPMKSCAGQSSSTGKKRAAEAWLMTTWISATSRRDTGVGLLTRAKTA